MDRKGAEKTAAALLRVANARNDALCPFKSPTEKRQQVSRSKVKLKSQTGAKSNEQHPPPLLPSLSPSLPLFFLFNTGAFFQNKLM